MKNEANKPLPAIANTINADLLPKVRKWLAKNHPEANFTDSELSTLLCYATTPKDFRVPTPATAGQDWQNGKLSSFKGIVENALVDPGMVQMHQLMLSHPEATVAALSRFQHEDRKRMLNRVRRALRAENLEGMKGNELVEYLVDVGEFNESERPNLRRRLQEMRSEDAATLKGIDPVFLKAET